MNDTPHIGQRFEIIARASTAAPLSPHAVFPPINTWDTSSSNIWNSAGAPESYARFAAAEWYRDILSRMTEMLPDAPGGSIIIDAGSGTGAGSIMLAKRFGQSVAVIGVDPAESQVSYARNNTPENLNLFYACGDYNSIAHTLPEPPFLFTAFNSIHTFGPIDDTFKAAGEQLPSGGYLAFCSGFTSQMYAGNGSGIAMTSFNRAIALAKEDFAEHFISRHDRNPAYGTKTFLVNINELPDTAKRRGFNLERLEFQKYTLDRESIANYLSLPGIGDAILPDTIPYSARRGIYLSALEQCGVEQLFRNWCFAVARKV